MAEAQIRPARHSDISDMARLWQEKMTLQQQSDRRYCLAPDAVQRWSQAVAQYLDDARMVVFVAEAESELAGYIIARCQPSPAGLLPEAEGLVVDMAVGIHSGQSGLGRRLLEPARQWFAEQGLTRMVAYVTRQSPVEQAFWRAMGVVDAVDVLWMKL